MNTMIRKVIGTAAVAGLLMAGSTAAAQAKDGVEDQIDLATGAAVVEDNGVHGPGHVDPLDAPDDGNTALAPAADPAAIPETDEATAAEDAAKDAAEAAEEEAEAEAVEDAVEAEVADMPEAPHAEGLDDAPGAADDGL